MTRGQLTKDKLGYAMPVDAPLYGRLPVNYSDVSMLIFEYTTDPEAAAALLPAQLELTDPAVALLLFAEYPQSDLGPYNEVAQALVCTYKGQTMTYAVRLHVTNDAALTMGRESGGFPKKMGDISFAKDPAYVSALERPAGQRVCSAVMEKTEKLPTLLDPIDFASLRVIPNIEPGAPPSLCQLMQTRWLFPAGELWNGTGSFQFATVDSDPYYKLPVRQVLKRQLFLGTMQVAAAGGMLENF
jgi:acetoacetate decarboxylase